MSLSYSMMRTRARRTLGCGVLSAVLCAVVSHTASPVAIAQTSEIPDGARQYDELARIYGSRSSDSAAFITYEDIRGRDAWFNYQRSFPYAHIPANGRLDALRAARTIEQSLLRARSQNDERSGAKPRDRASLFAGSQWEPIGPLNQGGRIRALAVHPTQPDVYLIGAAAGGVWKTYDDAASWLPTFDSESAIAVGSLAFDYSDPRIVYAGTGENFPSSPTLLTNTPSYLGNGVFKSTDEGLTWTHSGLGVAGAVSKLFVHRQRPSIVYAAVAKQSGGFYRSTDAGASWTLTASGDLYDMTVNPMNSDEVYIAHPNQIRKSTDGGLTFANASTGISTAAGVRFSISISASDPTHLYVLAARRGGANGGEIAEVYKSTNSAVSWQRVVAMGESFFNSQGIYDNFIAVHPTNPDIVLAGGIDVFRTTDGGVQWENTTRSYSGGDVHPDQHVAEFNPSRPNIVILGNDGGLYVSGNEGANWRRESDDLAITQFYRMEVDQSRPYRVYGGTQDNGTSGSFDANGFSGNWTNVLGGDGFFVIADKSDPNWFYAEIYYGTMYRINGNNLEQRRRVDGGIAASDDGNWATPIAMSPIDHALYSGRTNLWRTLNRGQSWASMATGINSKIAAIGLSPIDVNRIAVGGVTGGVRYSTDYGQTWAAARGIASAVVTDIRFDANVAERVYATLSGFGASHVYRSDNSGADWIDISSNLPRIPVNAIEIDPVDPSRLFIGTDIGVFISPNVGGFWIPFNPGLPLAPVADLEIHLAQRALVAATHGRSMFRIALDGIEIEPTLVVPLGGERVSTPGPFEVKWFGIDGPSNVYIKYSADEPYVLVASNVVGGTASIVLPMRTTTTARVRVEEIATGRILTSGFFSLVTAANATAIGRRGFTAEAIELRAGVVWATSRTSDTIHRLKLPLLTGSDVVVRSGFSGRIRDLAHDPVSDIFLALVTDDDFTSPRIYRMDTTGVAIGELTLPGGLATAVGIAMRGEDLAVMTNGPSPTLWLLDPTSGEERSRQSVANAIGPERRGLTWNGRELLQGVMFNEAEQNFNVELQQIVLTDPVRVADRVPIVLASGTDLRFVGLTYDPGAAGTPLYIATDTAGTFYRIRADIVSGTEVRFGSSVSAGISSMRVAPNPAIDRAVLELRLTRDMTPTIEIVDITGMVVAAVAPREIGAGTTRIPISVSNLAGGMYYVVVRTDEEREVHAFSIVR